MGLWVSGALGLVGGYVGWGSLCRRSSPASPRRTHSQADSIALSLLLADWLRATANLPTSRSLQREIQMDSPMLLADLPDLQEP